MTPTEFAEQCMNEASSEVSQEAYGRKPRTYQMRLEVEFPVKGTA